MKKLIVALSIVAVMVVGVSVADTINIDTQELSYHADPKPGG